MATKIGAKTREVAGMNPWWRDVDWAKNDVDLKPVAQTNLNYQPKTLKDLDEKGLYILRGPRRVGKTVLIKQKIQELLLNGVPPYSIIRIDVDGWDSDELRTLVQNIPLPPLSATQKRYWFLDEVTGVAGEWAKQIKWLRSNDTEFNNATVVLTGSSASGLTEAAGIIAGRRGKSTNVERSLLPMGFRTFAVTLDPRLAQIPLLELDDLHGASSVVVYQEANLWINELTNLWELYLQYGGFPIAVSAAKVLQPIPAWFIDSLLDVIYRDAFAKSSLSRAKTTSLVARIWESMSTPINLSSVGKDLGVDAKTVERHITYLRDAHLLWECPKLDKPWVANDRAQYKVYPIDPIIGRLAHLKSTSRPDIDVTILSEAQIGTGFKRGVTARGGAWDGESAFFYQTTPSRKEIDFVSELFNGVAVESKYTDSGSWVRESATLNASTHLGIMATRSVLDLMTHPTWAIPASLLAFLTDI